ncbi:MAG: NAD(P)-dependent oxidoreductase [Planctomycetes bacterium]|nr:NAD(P)-dependent oxidoreductase [Planctomycetota bacterium]
MSDIDLKNRRVVLVGGAGFIGHHLALQLKAAGAHVEIIDGLQVNNLLTYSAFNGDSKVGELYLSIINQRLDLIRQAGIPLHPQDARDYHAFGRILEKIKPQAIVHLAAVAHAGSANKDPYSTFDHSLRTLENALDYARGKLEQFVFFSSSMAYGNFMTPEVSEEHPLNPMGIYGALKLSGEKMVIAYNQVFNLPYTIVRPSALYGPRCVSRRVGQIFIESAMKSSPLRVDGDGNEKLDFTYIDDLVQGIKLVLQKPQAINQTFNITYGQSRSINDLVEIVRKSFEGIPVEYVKRDKLMPFRGTLSIKKAQEMLGYKPENPIEVGIPKYIDWYRKLDKNGQFMIDIKVER